MPGKYTDGFTKAAQKQKFVRNRDIKMKDSEIKKEQKIQKLMCEGICKRCREKVQWRFQYDKYKPLKNPANCQDCHQKTIVKAYRTLCDKCAQNRKVCPSCCQDMTAANEEAVGASDSANQPSSNSSSVGKVVSSNASTSGAQQTTEEVNSNEMEMESEVIDEGQNVEGSDDEENDEEENANEEEAQDHSMDFMVWDEKKFRNIANSKYSKNRVVGKEEF